jgi:type IX secretion system PorP/SprF family membrane protein
MYRFLIFLFLPIFTAFYSQGQDIHFSQFMSSPLFLNPALTGSFSGDFRISALNRSQWNSFTNGYKTLAFSAETNFLQNRYVSLPFSGALHFRSDIAGDGRFGISELQIPIAYHFRLTPLDEWISFAVMPGIVQHSLDFSQLNFGSQFNGERYDPGSPSNENFAGNNLVYYDMSTGLSAGLFITPHIKSRIGIGLFHFLRPVISFDGDEEIRLSPRLSAHASATIKRGKYWSFEPSAMYSRQIGQQEFVFGSLVRLDTESSEFRGLIAGFFYRWDDALIAEWGFDYLQFRTLISYDINFSGLKRASHYRGGPEFSLVYIFDLKQEISKIPSKKCPAF